MWRAGEEGEDDKRQTTQPAKSVGYIPSDIEWSTVSAANLIDWSTDTEDQDLGESI
jgi:hypothetical protein